MQFKRRLMPYNDGWTHEPMDLRTFPSTLWCSYRCDVKDPNPTLRPTLKTLYNCLLKVLQGTTI